MPRPHSKSMNVVIPGRRSQRVRPLAGPMTGSAQANPESNNEQPLLLDSGFSIIGLRPMISLRNDRAYGSNEIATRC
jgi:hypothetical protein